MASEILLRMRDFTKHIKICNNEILQLKQEIQEARGKDLHVDYAAIRQKRLGILHKTKSNLIAESNEILAQSGKTREELYAEGRANNLAHVEKMQRVSLERLKINTDLSADSNRIAFDNLKYYLRKTLGKGEYLRIMSIVTNPNFNELEKLKNGIK
jgi:hypothetical protein